MSTPAVGLSQTTLWSQKMWISDFLVKYGLLILFILAYVAVLSVRPLIIPDEVRYGEIAREMLVSGDWLVPRLNGVVYFEKPPMGHWLNAIALALFGENAFAVRIMSALSTGTAAIAVFTMVRLTRHSQSTALAAAFVYLTTLEVYGVGTFSVLDSMFTLFLNLGMALFYFAATSPKRLPKITLLLATGILLGCAFLTKGFLAVVIPSMVFGIWLVWTRQTRMLFILAVVVTLALVLTVAPWGWLIHKAQPDFWRYFIWVEHIQRFMAEDAQHKRSFFYFIALLPFLAFPWITFLPAAVKGLRQPSLENNSPGLLPFLFLWLAIPFVFFSISSGKLLTYILPCFMPLAMLITIGLERYRKQHGRRLVQAGLLLNAASLMIFTIAIVVFQYRVDAVSLYTSVDGAKFWILLACVLIFTFLLIFITTRDINRNTFLANGLIAIVLLICINNTLPQSLFDHKAPESMLEEIKSTITPDSVIISDGSLVRAASWYLKRTDIILHDYNGELDYGITAEGRDRFKNQHAIGQYITAITAKREVVVLCKEECKDEILSVIPQNAQRWKSGQFHAYRIPIQRVSSN